MLEYQSIEAPSNQQYQAHFLQNKIILDLTPIHSPESLPKKSKVNIEESDNNNPCLQFFESHHKSSASTNYLSPFTSESENNNQIQVDLKYQLKQDIQENQVKEFKPSSNMTINKTDVTNTYLLHVKTCKKQDDLGSELSPIDSNFMNGGSNKSTESKLSIFQQITINNNSAQLIDDSMDNSKVEEVEKKKVFILREEVLKKIEGKKDLLQIYNKFNNFTFVKFLRAREGQISYATTMFVDFLQWRLDNQVDSIKNQISLFNQQEFSFTEFEQVQNFYPHGFHGVDNEGRPIWIENLGKLNLKELMKVTNQERLKKYFIQNFERLLNEIFPICSLNAQKPVHQYIIVLDMKDHKLSLSELKNFLNMTSSITKNNYPEILYKMYIINAGSFFTVVWKGVKYILNEKTRQKVEILGNSFIKSIAGKIKVENLPIFLGGSCKHCEEINQSNQKNKRVLLDNVSQFLKI